jgi:hypothetical protein
VPVGRVPGRYHCQRFSWCRRRAHAREVEELQKSVKHGAAAQSGRCRLLWNDSGAKNANDLALWCDGHQTGPKVKKHWDGHKSIMQSGLRITFILAEGIVKQITQCALSFTRRELVQQPTTFCNWKSQPTEQPVSTGLLPGNRSPFRCPGLV